MWSVLNTRTATWMGRSRPQQCRHTPDTIQTLQMHAFIVVIHKCKTIKQPLFRLLYFNSRAGSSISLCSRSLIPELHVRFCFLHKLISASRKIIGCTFATSRHSHIHRRRRDNAISASFMRQSSSEKS